VDRRRFLGGAIVGVAGLATGGTALEAGQLGRAARERGDSALPDGPGRDLGWRRLIWSVPTSAPLVALTFDDGPDLEFTPRILALLRRYDVRATFNVMGYNAVRHRDLIQALTDTGHELGNHTWSHEDLAFQSAAATSRQLERGLAAIERTAGVRPRFFRPPRGELTGAAVQAAARLGHDVLLWSVTRGPAGVGTPAAVPTTSPPRCGRVTSSGSTTASAGAPSTAAPPRPASSGPAGRWRWPPCRPRSSGSWPGTCGWSPPRPYWSRVSSR
jgi:peptidoglycan-N-acetylglucosamine deacetylase